MFNHISKRVVTAVAVIAVAGVPAAAVARPLEDPAGSSFSATPPVVQSSAPQPAAQAEQGFEWGDAGVGAAGMLVLVGVGSGAVVAVRRRGGHALLG